MPQTIQPTPPPVVLLQMITGSWLSQLIYAAAKLRIADLLKDDQRSTKELAEATGTHEPSLYRVLRALASVGVFTETAPRQFALTPLADCLREDCPGSLRYMSLMFGSEWHRRTWENILFSLKTGQPAFEHVYGMKNFDYYAQHPEDAEVFNNAMTGFANQAYSAAVAAYDFSGITKLVDVGGGHGTLISMILKSYPQMRGVLFDLPHVVAGADVLLQEASVANRCEIVGGSFFDAIPEGADAYIMSMVVHDWDDERAAMTLTNCHKAMKDGGRILVVEQVIPSGDEPFFGKLLDIEMLLATPGGRERTEAEFRQLFESADLKLNRIVPTPSPICVIEAVSL